MEEQNLTTPATVEVVDIQFRPGQKVYYFDPAGNAYQAGDHLIIETARGPEYGTCTAGNHFIPEKDVVAPLRTVLRLANAQDEKTVADNRAKEKRAFDVCMQKIAEHQLDMQLVSAEVAFDGSKILFFFTADERVDFRELVKNLASIFHTRIELRQIGVRDKAKMVGGLGICGRPFCCASFLDDFQPVSIKMAKTQNLSLNPTKISGTCGRLMCCLKYEQDAYEDLISTSPKLDSFVDTPEGRGTVIELNLLRQQVKVRLEEQPETVVTCPNAEIAVWRNGKAKKNDPPIPADWAPISGSGKRVRKTEEDAPVLLDPIRFRYSTETIADAAQAAEQEEPAEEKTAERRSRRRSRKGKGHAEETAAEAAENPAKQPEKPKLEKQGEKSEKQGKKQGKKPEKQAEKSAPKSEKPAKHSEKAENSGEKAEQTGAETGAQSGEGGKPRRRSNYHHRRRKPKQPTDGGSNT